MKKIICLLMLCMFSVGCEPIDNTTETKNEVIETVVNSTCFKVKFQGSTKCIYYEFTYKDHVYISNFQEKFLIHSPSCPCHNASSLFNSNFQTSGSSLFN